MKHAYTAILVLTTIGAYAAAPVTMSITRDNGQILLDWNGGSGLYELQGKSDLNGPWRTLSPVTTVSRAVITVQIATNSGGGLITTRPGTVSGNPQPSEPAEVLEVFRVDTRSANDLLTTDNAFNLIANGRNVFRYDTFGCETFWGDTLKLHEAIAGSGNGGVGPGLSPRTALALGLKVDADALPTNLIALLQANQVNLDEPTNTLALLQLNAVVGVTGFFTNGSLRSVGIHCALCHSTVNDSLTAGIGQRLDGWPNRDLDVGQIIALAPDKSFFTNHFGLPESAIVNILTNWGPGKFDAELILDGKGFRPDGKTAATLMPAAFGLAGVNLHTYTGWGSVTHWNAFVANLEMQGQGTFFDPRLNDTNKFPFAVKAGLFNVRKTPDRISSKLAALHLYQLAIPAPKPPTNTFDAVAAGRGEGLFAGKAQCATCHVPPLFAEPGWPMHTAAEIGIDDFQALRSPDERYRTTPLKGLFVKTKGGFYHDGRFPTLEAVVDHYNTNNIPSSLGLTDPEKDDLVEFLKSL